VSRKRPIIVIVERVERVARSLVLRIGRRAVLGLIILATVTFASMRGAAASCVAVPSPRQAVSSSPLVFMGKVIGLSNRGRTAAVRVVSVWKGPRLPRVVEVQGSSATTPDVLTSVDRRFRVGRRYLFIPPGNQRGPTLRDNACSSTVEYSTAVAKLAPTTTT
jgi:hypothetical protein